MIGLKSRHGLRVFFFYALRAYFYTSLSTPKIPESGRDLVQIKNCYWRFLFRSRLRRTSYTGLAAASHYPFRAASVPRPMKKYIRLFYMENGIHNITLFIASAICGIYFSRSLHHSPPRRLEPVSLVGRPRSPEIHVASDGHAAAVVSRKLLPRTVFPRAVVQCAVVVPAVVDSRAAARAVIPCAPILLSALAVLRAQGGIREVPSKRSPKNSSGSRTDHDFFRRFFLSPQSAAVGPQLELAAVPASPVAGAAVATVDVAAVAVVAAVPAVAAATP